MQFIEKRENVENSSILQNNLSDLNYICSSYINFQNPKWVEIDGIYYASLIVINYSREIEGLFLSAIAMLDIDIQISMFYEKKNSYEVIKELTYRIGNAGANLKMSNQNQQNFEILGGVYEDAKYIRKQLQMGEEDLFYCTIYLGTFSTSIEDLERNLQRIESIAISAGITTIRANYRQENVFCSTLPFLKNDIEINKFAARNVLSSGLISTYPFVSNTLYDKDGIFIGTNNFDKSLILLNRFDTTKYKNANMFVLGTSRFREIVFCKINVK